MNKGIDEFLLKLDELIQEAPKYLDMYPMLHLGVDADLRRIHGRCSQVAGQAVVTNRKVAFEPITEFMGDPINRAAAIIPQDITPQELEVKILLDKTERLDKSFDTLKNSDILDSYKDDLLPIRLLAKRAGLADYKDVPVNEAFLEEIRVAREDRKKVLALKKKDEALTK